MHASKAIIEKIHLGKWSPLFKIWQQNRNDANKPSVHLAAIFQNNWNKIHHRRIVIFLARTYIHQADSLQNSGGKSGFLRGGR